MSTSAQAAPHDFIEGVEFPTYFPIKLGYRTTFGPRGSSTGVRPEKSPAPRARAEVAEAEAQPRRVV